jgi:hypothetical protein
VVMNVFTCEEIYCDTVKTLTFVYLEIRGLCVRMKKKTYVVNLILRIRTLNCFKLTSINWHLHCRNNI